MCNVSFEGREFLGHGFLRRSPSEGFAGPLFIRRAPDRAAARKDAVELARAGMDQGDGHARVGQSLLRHLIR